MLLGFFYVQNAFIVQNTKFRYFVKIILKDGCVGTGINLLVRLY